MEAAKHELALRKGRQEESIQRLERDRLEIHGRIQATQAVSADDAAFCEATRQLQDVYNELSDALESKKSPLSQLADPLEALPVEIWTQIILDATYVPPLYLHDPAADNIFGFILVSKAWFSKLNDNAPLWAAVRLTGRTGYATKARIRLRLSRTSLLRVESGLSREQWSQFRPWLQPHADRIVELVQSRTNLLRDLPALPSLRRLHSSLSLPTEFRQVESTDPGRMPLLETFEGYPNKVSATSPWFPFIVNLSYSSTDISEKEIEAWPRARNLRSLYVVEGQSVQSQRADSVGPRKLPLTYLSYSGPNVKRALTWVGTALTRLRIFCGNPSQLWDIAHAIVHATSLEHLELNAIPTTDETTPGEDHATKPFSVPQTSRTLALVISSHPYPVPNDVEWISWSQSFHRLLPLAFPRVHNLTIDVEYMTLALLKYVEGLGALRHLRVSLKRLEDVGDFVLRVNPGLLLVQWSRVRGTTGLFDFPKRTYGSKDFPLYIELTRSDTIGTGDLAVLPLSFEKSLVDQGESIVGIWNAEGRDRLLYGIRMLQIDPRQSEVFLNDFIESLALRPSEHPTLEAIQCPAKVIEWDVLFLMLERRNLLRGLEARRISRFMLDTNTPGCIKRVFEKILSGKYPSRDALREYSLEAVGRRMFDRKRTGCMRCCHLLRDCDSAIEGPSADPSNTTYETIYEQIASEYILPHEHTKANPPLSPREALWLAGKRRRRQEFVRGFKESLKKFRRKPLCKSLISYE